MKELLSIKILYMDISTCDELHYSSYSVVQAAAKKPQQLETKRGGLWYE